MTPYNIEIFHPDFTLLQHYTVGDLVYFYDYLSPMECSVILPFDSSVAQGDYIYIRGGESTYFGVITTISVDDMVNGYAQISYKPFLSLFDALIMFDTSLQGTSTLEQVLSDILTALYINNSDSSQNIPGLEITTISSTSSWGFNIKSEVEGLSKAIINLYSVLIARSLSEYRVGIYVTPDFENQTITLEIGIAQATTHVIEADLPSVISKSIIVKETDATINKLIVYDKTDMSTSITYYKHTDGTYSTTDTDRIYPVVFTTKSVSVVSDTFASLAASEAAKLFSGKDYSNLIEITVSNDDTLVMPSDITIGQEVEVISNGVSYTSIFSGYEKQQHIKLIFGTVRTDLTKILKGVISNG